MKNRSSDTDIKRFAFIDVQNTETTALKVLKFAVDHGRLYEYLKTRWQCEKVFFYPGIEYDDDLRTEIFAELERRGAYVRAKYYHVYKNKDKIININCPKCDTDITERIDMGHTWKCNCDVELTADVLDCAKEGVEILLYSGDGDFEFLLKKIVAIGAKVTIISSARMQQKGPRYATSRLSKKLRKLVKEKGAPVRFIELDNLKFRIRKEP